MPVPKQIPIAHEPGYRTDRIGRYDEGKFLASAQDHHAYVHLFNHNGVHQRSVVQRVPNRNELDGVLEMLVANLPSKVYGDIAVQLF